MQMPTRKQIVIVDDDPNYIDLLNRALSTCQPLCHLKALSTGPELLEWLETSHRPNLIFLDIYMPGPSGFDVLKKLKTRESYKAIPVIMLSVSNRRQDMEISYDIGADGYIEKPEVFADLLTCMRLMTKYWFDVGSTPGSNWTSPNGFNLN
jgi:CheY-like chemotaxis protein